VLTLCIFNLIIIPEVLGVLRRIRHAVLTVDILRKSRLAVQLLLILFLPLPWACRGCYMLEGWDPGGGVLALIG